MKRLLLLGILAVCFITISSAHAQVAPMNNYCISPVIGTNATPNVLIVLDNSNSMDEDFYGNAAGSFNSTSKMVIGKKALIKIVNQFKAKLRMGLETFSVGSSVFADYIHNSPYFASYQVKSFCPNSPPECVDYCKTGNLTSKATCTTSCQALNAAFDPDYFDTIITANAIGSATRNKYCNLVYPKTQFRETEPVSYPGIITYYKQSLPFYDGGSDGIAHCYSAGYSTAECVSTTVGPFNSYNCYYHKTDNTDNGGGYLNNDGINGQFSPTDSDIAAGYLNFGQRLSWWVISRTWFKNSSAGGGYMHVNVDDLEDVNNNTTATYTNIISKLDPKEGDETGYMSCSSGNKDTCSYIISAGLTPTAGTFRTAMNYFQGVTDYQSSVSYTSPIQTSCQKNFVVFVTDGLPSTNETGGTDTADNLIPTNTSPPYDIHTVLGRINALRSTVKGSYTYDIKTYVLGVGLTPDAKAKLDLMAGAGGTADVNGHAYYADKEADLLDALTLIFQDITAQALTGSGLGMLGSSQGTGANIIQALYFPKKTFGSVDINWVGELKNLWYYVDPYLRYSTVREDTDYDNYLNLTKDYVLLYKYDTLTNATYVEKDKDNGDGTYTPVTGSTNADLDGVNHLWDAGVKLHHTAAANRLIYASTGTGLIEFKAANVDTLRPFMQAQGATLADQTTDAINIINYVRGVDSSSYRNRTVTAADAHNSTTTDVWKLGDIVSSTARIQAGMPLNSYHLPQPDGYGDSSYQSFVNSTTSPDYVDRGTVYVNANDGMLHAFALGKVKQLGGDNKAELDPNNLGAEQWAFIPKNVLPYLTYLKEKAYKHVFTMDGPIAISDVSTGSQAKSDLINGKYAWKTVLVGSMGIGGASKDKGNCTSGKCVEAPLTGTGMSTYYALDITNPNAPGYLWEFTDNHLGYSTTGATIVRTGDPDSNGNWFAVFASGPTGPIDTVENKFLADSDQNLHIFVLDLMTGALIRDIDTGITNAFGGSMVNASLDVDRWRDKYNTEGSRYEDDVIYVGYNKKTTTGDWRGGVIRISPKTWTWSTVVDTTDDGNMGPVTAGVAKLVNPKIGSAALYLFFGTGRYNYKLSNGTVDDPVDKQYLYAVKEDSSCYNKDNGVFSFCASHGTILWSKQLAQDDGTYYAERCLTTPTANFNGNIILITYQPFRNVCSTGGATYAWILNYLTGSTSITSGGKYLIMLGGGLIENYETTTGGKNFITYTKGTTPIDPGTGIFFPKPLRKILHIKER